MFPDNNWYGHRYILLKYMGLKDREIYASLQHGWISEYINTNYKNRIYPVLCWSKVAENRMKVKNNLNVHAIGAPFLYLCKMFKERTNKKKKNENSMGTIVFPSHSSQDLDHITNHKKLIESVEKDFKGPFTVCFYYYDLNEKDIEIYKKKSWRIVCCVRGRTDKFSLIRLYKEINKHNTVVSGEFSTSLFYGMYLKKNTKIYFDSNERFKYYSEIEKNMIRIYKKKYPSLFKTYLSGTEGFNFAAKELGLINIRKKDELKKLIGVSLIKKFLAKILSILYDLKYGNELREGKDLPKKRLIKYINNTRY